MANVVFLWHMHQPYYVDPATQTATMPWVRLHAVKGYFDMIATIEDFPAVRANFNLTPVLMLQMKELVEGRIRDRWLEWSRKPAADLDEAERFAILESFFKIHWDHSIRPFPRYWELLNKRGLTFYRDDVRRGQAYWSVQELLDLQVWFNLAWCGHAAQRLYPELGALKAKGRYFTEEEKQRVLAIHLEIMALLPRRYREAEERGQIELTTTPFFHPILPLVYDSAFAGRSQPGREFPPRFAWPQDAEAQLTLAVDQHAAMFGQPPRGLWPSEGAIAPELIPLMQECGIEYFCSDEENLFASLRSDPAYSGVSVDHLELFQGWRVHCDGASVNAIFREKPLSDFIGFKAAKNDPAKAAQHLLYHLRHISELVPRDTGVIPLILDGENAWETFADGGEGFLRALYGGIQADQARLYSATMEDYFRHHPPRKQLNTLHTGSWISSNFDLWIGEAEENRAWRLLGETRAFLAQRSTAGTINDAQRAAALRAIYAAEGSDWFWWYGPDFSTENDAQFDELFRKHLRSVYAVCGQLPPALLDLPISHRRVRSPYELPHRWVQPPIRGTKGAIFDWVGAGRYIVDDSDGGGRIVTELRFGNDATNFYLRLDLRRPERIALVVQFDQPAGATIRTAPLVRADSQPFSISRPGAVTTATTLAAYELVTFAAPLAQLGGKLGDAVSFQVKILLGGAERECHPETASIQFTLLDEDWELTNWVV